MVDAVDSKSTDSNIMWVQVPSPVPNMVKWLVLSLFFMI